MTITSIFGLQSGFNTSEIVDKLIALQQRPLEAKVSERELQIEKLDLLKQLRSLADSFESVVRQMDVRDRLLKKVGDFLGDTSTAKVGINTSVFSPTGSFAINVTQLAKVGIVRSDDNFSSATSVYSPDDPGSMDITVGGVLTSVAITNTDTLQDVVDKINASAADVTAKVVDSGSGATPFSIVIEGNTTGSTQTVSALFVEAGADQTFTSIQTAQDALFTLDTISYTRSSNTVNDVITGTTLTLDALGSGAINISIDADSIRTKVEDFVDKFNELKEFFDENAFFDSDSLESGPLFGQFSVRNLKETLSDLVSSEVTGLSSSFTFLSQIGIRTQDDGSLAIDDAALTSALISDPEGVANLFYITGSATNVNVDFISATSKTEEGTFELQVTGGVPEIRKVGEASFTPAVQGPGNTFIGASGTSAEGLAFSIDSSELGTDGSKGTITVSVGIAEKLDRLLTFNTDTTQDGPLMGDINTTTEKIEDLNDVILRLDDRLRLFEEQIQQEFIQLEVVLGQLDAQRQAIQSSLTNLSGLLKKN
ncbi:flagellar filament capping protein FliD [Nitrospina gracilis]|uniref:flagellar filament capping protein FliD n=1 Tax=Nitrospina gracilis TaxID=35801 RepID=UPI001F02556F|nr:flagellar filament capping protein FliD [Nitrospina gracilis]MCF8720353.1 flagellar hook-associated protein 2 [Nitrospina gracilis Nb-211]